MIYLLPIIQGILGRMAGGGFWAHKLPKFLPELLHSLPYGVALGWGLNELGVGFLPCLVATAIGTGISYAGMQSATWMFLRWEKHDDPNTERTSTLKPIVDWIATRFGWKLGDEGYAWVAAGVKGFIITLPVGGVLGAILWPLGYEIGSHAKGRVERFGLDPHAFSEFLSATLTSLSILMFLWLIV